MTLQSVISSLANFWTICLQYLFSSFIVIKLDYDRTELIFFSKTKSKKKEMRNVFVLIAQLRVTRFSSNRKQKRRRPKSCFRKTQSFQFFIPKLKKVDSSPKTTYYDGSEFVHKPYIHFRCMRCILLKDLAFLVVNLGFFWGRTFKNGQIRSENATFSKIHYYHVNSHKILDQ